MSGDTEPSIEAWESFTGNSEGSFERSDFCCSINTMVATRQAEEERTGFGIGKDGDPSFTLQEAHCNGICAEGERNG